MLWNSAPNTPVIRNFYPVHLFIRDLSSIGRSSSKTFNHHGFLVNLIQMPRSLWGLIFQTCSNLPKQPLVSKLWQSIELLQHTPIPAFSLGKYFMALCFSHKIGSLFVGQDWENATLLTLLMKSFPFNEDQPRNVFVIPYPSPADKEWEEALPADVIVGPIWPLQLDPNTTCDSLCLNSLFPLLSVRSHWPNSY